MAQFEALAQFVDDRKDFAKTESRSTRHDDFAKYLRIYRNYTKKKTGKKVSLPIAFATTYRLYAMLMSEIRSNPEIGRFVGEPVAGSEVLEATTAGKIMEQAAAYYTKQGRLMQAVKMWELEALVMGTSFLKTTWDYREGEVIGDEIENLGGIRQYYNDVLYDGLKFEHRPLDSIYIDPKVLNYHATVDDMEFLIDERYISAELLFANPRFFNKDEVIRRHRSAKRASMRTENEISESMDQASGSFVTGSETRDNQSDMLRVVEYWGIAPEKLLRGKNKEGYATSDLKGFVESHIIVAEDVVVFAEENPYPGGRKPYDVIRAYPSLGFHGIGVPELIKPMIRVINGIANQRLDNVALALNRMFAFSQGRVNPKHVKSRPGGLIPVRGPVMEGIRELPVADVTQSSYAEHNAYENVIQKSTGVSDMMFGQSAKQTRMSGTEAAAIAEMGAGMVTEILEIQIEDGLIPLAEKIRDYIQAFNTRPLNLEVQGKIVEVTPEQLVGNFEIVPTVGQMMFTKQAEMQKNMTLMQVTLQVLPILQQQGKRVDISQLLEGVYNAAGRKDYSTVVSGANQEIEPEQAQSASKNLLGSGSGGEAASFTGGGGDNGSGGAEAALQRQFEQTGLVS